MATTADGGRRLEKEKHAAIALTGLVMSLIDDAAMVWTGRRGRRVVIPADRFNNP